MYLAHKPLLEHFVSGVGNQFSLTTTIKLGPFILCNNVRKNLKDLY